MAGTHLDRKLFGLGETFSMPELKQRYRELLKQYHPDLHDGDSEYHRRIIRLNDSYARLAADVSGERVERAGKTGTFHEAPGQPGLVRHKDPAYVYYKEGIRHYRAIYPSSRPRVVKDLFRVRQPVMTPEEEEEKLNTIFTAFSKAIYYFTVVTTDYEDSVWYTDAREKVTFLMRHLKRYQAWKDNLFKNTRGKRKALS